MTVYQYLLKSLSIGTPKAINFPFVPNGKLMVFKIIYFTFATNKKLMVLGVTTLKHITVHFYVGQCWNLRCHGN